MMSAFGTKRTIRLHSLLSAIGVTTDNGGLDRSVDIAVRAVRSEDAYCFCGIDTALVGPYPVI